MPTSERAPMRERGIPDGYRPVDGSERRPAPGAVQCGPADPLIGQASRRCFEAADSALARLGAPAEVRQAVTDFTERYVLKDRCPADDQLDGVSP